MATSTDIANRALQMAMARNTISSLADGSNEANNVSLIYTPTLEWCLSVANWNFARNTAVLSVTKIAPGSPGTWTNIYPPPPWAFAYAYPSDAVRIRYVTNMAVSSGKWSGQPARFQIAHDPTANATVILTDAQNAIATYTKNITTVDQWDKLFQQAFTAQLAWMLAAALSGKEELVLKLIDIANHAMTLAVTTNMREGLIIDDTTPEWIVARGIVSPNRRPPTALAPAPKQDNSNG